MWPWGHLAVGYLCYVAAIRLRGTGEQTLFTLLAVGFGSQFPDVVDKPLAWSVSVLPSGRSLAHSLLTAAVVIGAAYWFERRRGRERGREEAVAAFGIGYVSHSLVDLGPEVVVGLLRGDWGQVQWTTYLLWPVLPSPPYSMDSSFAEQFAAFALEPYVVFEFALFGVAVGVWVASGSPGVREVRERVRDRLGLRT